MESESNGAAIGTEDVNHLLIESCTFVNCRMTSSSGDGAAIDAQNGKSIPHSNQQIYSIIHGHIFQPKYLFPKSQTFVI